MIGANDITLDLNGHTIDGKQFGVGVNNMSGHDRVEVTDGVVQEFSSEIADYGGDDNHVHGMTIRRGFFGFETNSSNGVAVDNNVLSENDVAISVRFESSNADVSHNTVLSGGPVANDIGILLYFASESQVEHNSVRDLGAGIQLSASDSNSVEHNELIGNDQGMVIGLQDQYNVIDHNTIRGSNYFGIRLEESFDNRIEFNHIEDSMRSGIALDPVSFGGRSRDNLIAGNLVSSSRMGIYLAGSDHNTIDSNRITDGDLDGIVIATGSARNVVEGNSANRNSDDGIDTDNSTTVLSKNSADKNGDLGIEAPPGVTDGGGNRASGNGNPLQCLNVACK